MALSFERLPALARGMQHIANFSPMYPAITDLYILRHLGDRRQVEMRPAVGIAQEISGKVVQVKPLHDDKNDAFLLVVESREHGVAKPLIDGVALGASPLPSSQPTMQVDAADEVRAVFTELQRGHSYGLMWNS